MFKDRKDAGHKLFKLVSQYKHEIDLVLAIPRGGIEVGMSIAQDLGKPLQMVTAKKIGAPHNSEVAIGAVAPDGSTWFNDELVQQLNLSDDQLHQLSVEAIRHQDKNNQTFGSVKMEEVADKGVLLVDDGAATGATILASIETLRRAGAHPVGVAVPVAPIEVVSIMEDRADYFLALETPSDFLAVSQYYEEF